MAEVSAGQFEGEWWREEDLVRGLEQQGQGALDGRLQAAGRKRGGGGTKIVREGGRAEGVEYGSRGPSAPPSAAQLSMVAQHSTVARPAALLVHATPRTPNPHPKPDLNLSLDTQNPK